FSWSLGALTLASCLCIQIATNLFNDVIDFEKGADTEARKGAKRVTQSGLISRRTVWMGAWITLGLACLFALPLIQARGWPILAIGIPSLYFAFGYTGGPLPLAYRGLGELFVVLFFGLVAVSGTYFVQTGDWSWPPVVLGLQVGMLSTVLIAVNNLRDIEEDRVANKRTLAVRLGTKFARFEIAGLCFLPILLGAYWFPHEKLATILPLLAGLLGIAIVSKVVRTEPSPAYNQFLGMSALQLLAFGALFTFGILR
ncbi:MAG: 1,4-dihydroxy-2-naphthoate octaprenyltransferase, partial [Verrucomicrobiota bacterium]